LAARPEPVEGLLEGRAEAGFPARDTVAAGGTADALRAGRSCPRLRITKNEEHEEFSYKTSLRDLRVFVKYRRW
jgi:hypothetical protein